MKEWLCEENAISPPLTEEQKILLDSLPKLNLSDERLMGLCHPWKDALILTLLGKSVNLEIMKDRIAWILRSRNFELIDLPNNYFVFKTGNREMRLKLFFDGPWVIQGHYLAVQRWSPNFNPYKKCPLDLNSREDSSEKTQPVVNTSHTSKNQSYWHAQSKPLVSVPGINSDEEFGKWMIAKRNTKKRTHNLDPERKLGKMPKSNKSNGKGKKYASGSRESGSKEDVVGHIENEQLNLGTDERCALVTVEPHLEPPTEIERKEKATKVKEKAGKATKIVETRLEPSTEIEMKGTVTEVKEKEGKATDAFVGKPIILSQASLDYNLRPNGLSSVRNKKKAARDHNVIFGSTKTIESSKVNETKAPAGEKKKNYEEKEISGNSAL
ncbi:hypothetical protein K1719_035892 [Acacia pycnantha]|nr:hypothetical protein K1719_035892 [Acacia pycnantha]